MGIFLIEKGLTFESQFYLLFIGFVKNASGVVCSESKIRAKMFSKSIDPFSSSSPSMINIEKFLFLIGVEKKNDDLRKYYHRKINRWDAPINLLLVEKRQEVLRDKQRNNHPYEKKDKSFWIEGGKQESARKLLRITTIPEPESTQLPPTQLPPAQLPPAQTGEEINEGTLKVSELISLFQNKSGKTLNKRTRKQDIIAAILQYSERSE